MADNVTLNTGSGGDSIAADDIAGTKYQRVKLIHGVDGTNSGDAAWSNPMPVAAADRTDKISEGTATLLTPKFKVINLAASAELIALVASKKLRVVSLSICAGTAATNTFTFRSGGAAGSVVGIITVPASGAYASGYCALGIFETVAGENLYLALTSAVQTNGMLTYIEAT